jgi:hypothetical protein
MLPLIPFTRSLTGNELGDNYPSDVSVPGTTKGAIAGIVIFTVLAAIRVYWYVLKKAPVQGSHIGRRPPCGDWMHTPDRLLGMTLVAFLLKIIALGVDEW